MYCYFREICEEETSAYLRSYKSVLDDLDAKNQLDDSNDSLFGLFNTQESIPATNGSTESAFLEKLSSQINSSQNLSENNLLPEDTFVDTGSQESLLKKGSSSLRVQSYEKSKGSTNINKIESSEDEEIVSKSKKKKFKFDRKLFLKGQGCENNSNLSIKKTMLNDFKLQSYPDNESSD